MRIYTYLPERVREWNSSACAAERKNRADLAVIHEKQRLLQARMESLNIEFKMLEDVIAKGRTLELGPGAEDEEEGNVDEAMTGCVTCGANIQMTTAVRHMEKCYNKIESQTSFASRFKTQVRNLWIE